MKTKNSYILVGVGLFIVGLLFQLPTDQKKWAYESHCNDPEHTEIRQVFEGRSAGLKECGKHMNKHLDNNTSRMTSKGENHSVGCTLTKAQFPWSLFIN